MLVGDRLLTDIYLANLMGWKSVLTSPIEKTSLSKHGVGVYVMRKIENVILYLIK